MRHSDYKAKPVTMSNVKIADNFWSSRIETNRQITIPHIFKKTEETGRIKNFLRAAGILKDNGMPIFPFDDSDVYKIIEAAAYSLILIPDPELEKYIDAIIEKIAMAQEEDGYLYTTRSINPDNPHVWAGKKRWEQEQILSYELYNIGHLIESAVAYYEATGKRKMLDVAIKSIDLIDKVFGPGKNESTPGHQEIELALVRLYRTTGNEKYLKLAKFFLDFRGFKDAIGYEENVEKSKILFEYNQTHKIVIEQDEAVGHAVRATYMYSAMTDIAALTNDKNYIEAIDRIWDNVVSKKLSITGGVGVKTIREAFGRNYELPNIKAYNETCASIGNVFWNHRLFLLFEQAKYIDVLERVLYNGLLSGVSLNGKTFFYTNPLASRGFHNRSPWFDCPCCPPNLARFLASFSGYIYAQRNNKLFVNLFVGSNATFFLGDKKVSITQETEYPWKGHVMLKMNLQSSEVFTIAIRIPGWSQNQPVPSDLYQYIDDNNVVVDIKVNGQSIEIVKENGYAIIERSWKEGDIIEFNIPLLIRRIIAHENVKNLKGKVALERGPIVYCVEWPDNRRDNIFNLFLEDNAELNSEYRKDMLNGITVITGNIHYLQKSNEHINKLETEFLAIPYYAWANRGKGDMTIWMIRDLKAYKRSLD